MPRLIQLSEPRLAILKTIHDHIQGFGYAPTLREITQITGRGSFGTVAWHLEMMRDWGWVTWKPRTFRTLQLTSLGEALLEVHDD